MEIKPLHNVLLPVNNMLDITSKENLQNINNFLSDDGALIIFPAGEVSRFTPTGIKGCAWQRLFKNRYSR